MKKGFAQVYLLVGLIVLALIGGAYYLGKLSSQNIVQTKIILPSPTPTDSEINDTEAEKYTLGYSEGACNQDKDCQWAGEGCGGGHGVCTNQPEKYKPISTCDVNPNFPSNQGYNCGCISSVKKCGWKK